MKMKDTIQLPSLFADVSSGTRSMLDRKKLLLMDYNLPLSLSDDRKLSRGDASDRKSHYTKHLPSQQSTRVASVCRIRKVARDRPHSCTPLLPCVKPMVHAQLLLPQLPNSETNTSWSSNISVEESSDSPSSTIGTAQPIETRGSRRWRRIGAKPHLQTQHLAFIYSCRPQRTPKRNDSVYLNQRFQKAWNWDPCDASPKRGISWMLPEEGEDESVHEDESDPQQLCLPNESCPQQEDKIEKVQDTSTINRDCELMEFVGANNAPNEICSLLQHVANFPLPVFENTLVYLPGDHFWTCFILCSCINAERLLVEFMTRETKESPLLHELSCRESFEHSLSSFFRTDQDDSISSNETQQLDAGVVQHAPSMLQSYVKTILWRLTLDEYRAEREKAMDRGDLSLDVECSIFPASVGDVEHG